ncbi:hypothetical protein BB560_001357 [Smittium megazygosporum]|uniref:Uncharacterized protein n=1 Tax=Smittium megazygosporum TaxID=133381 RepID=A0A2T9ZHV1_9FUNG|nr:hypothetical protein BB560_001357 [Smittium megazygosporum]
MATFSASFCTIIRRQALVFAKWKLKPRISQSPSQIRTPFSAVSPNKNKPSKLQSDHPTNHFLLPFPLATNSPYPNL